MNKHSQIKWDKTFLQLAYTVAKNHSKDPNTKVGALLARDSYPLSFGYNGVIRGYPDTDDVLNNRDKKLIYTVHAEPNAILNAVRNNINIVDATMYCTHFPCYECMKTIIQAGIKRIVTIKDSLSKRWQESRELSIEMAKTCGVKYVEYDIKDIY